MASNDPTDSSASTLVTASDSDEGVVAPDDSDTNADDVAVAWSDVPELADVAASERDAVAQRLAAAWISDESDDTALLAAVIDAAGFGGFVDLLRGATGDAARLAAVMDTSALLRDPDRQVLEATKMSAAALVRAADRIDDLALDGDLSGACKECSALLVKMRSNLDKGRTSNPLAKLLRPNTAGLRFVVGDLLAQVSRRR